MSRIRMAPVLYSGRLILRAHGPADLDASAAMWGDPSVVEHISGRPSTRSQSWQRILTYAGLWSMLGYGYWAIEDRATGVFVGDVGLADFHRAIEPPLDGTPETGWVIAPKFWGKGYATEAIRAAVAWADASLDFDRTVCIVSPTNQASLRVAGKAGYVDMGIATMNDEPLRLFVRAQARH
jgi:RimJ/RimL family protein N-acetyltransferase